MKYLQKNKLQLQIEPHEKMELNQWASSTTILKQTLEQLMKTQNGNNAIQQIFDKKNRYTC